MPDADRIALIQQQLSEHGLTMKALSLAAGKGETFVRDMIKRGKAPGAANLEAIEDALSRLIGRVPLSPVQPEVRRADVPPIYRGTMAKDIPTMGTAAGAAAVGKGAFRISDSPIDYVFRPPGLANATGVYSIFVEGTSMAPMYEPGTLVYVNPHRPARPGDVVVIQDPSGDGEEFEGYLKILVRRTADWVIARQINPEGEIKFRASQRLRIHRVYTVNELFGV